MSDHELRTDRLTLSLDGMGGVTLHAPGWDALGIGPMGASLMVDGEASRPAFSCVETSDRHVLIEAEIPRSGLTWKRAFAVEPDGAIALRAEIANQGEAPFTLNRVTLLEAGAAAGGAVGLGRAASDIRLFEQGGYWARVRSPGRAAVKGPASGEEDITQAAATHASQFVWVAFDTAARMALLVGFETSERWLGHISTEGRPAEHPSGWSVGFDGGDLRVEPGERLQLEDVVLLSGPDPLALLAEYGDRVAARHRVEVLPKPPVSWCSWYPYRLGVSEERVLANAAVAAERLKPLGLGIMELDLGWEREYLPCAFEENDQFPHGLKWLSERLEGLGFVLGAWKGPFSISELDPLAREHPDWLAQGEDGKPLGLGQWFWEPHGETYALDLSHPEAQAWVREKIRSLADRGVRYLKPDFIGISMSGHLKRRHDRHVVTGGGCEAARAGMRIVSEEMKRGSPDALVLNCGCPDMPGTGAFQLLYTCNDTGNTGYVGWRHLRDDYGQAVAGHLWKNGRWGIIQPSCMVVGLPGTLEEARVRATATFLCGGQVDIGDELTSLPEDRWQVLLSTLPALGRSAAPLDLFEPIDAASLDYESQCRGQVAERAGGAGDDISRVWKLSVDAGWDQWDLFGLFNYAAEDAEYGKAQIVRFRLPLARLGLDPGASLWTYEFWSGQHIGATPYVRENPHGYKHPGDTQSLIASPEPGIWEISFFGPSVKLLVVRRARPHPWPVGTSFHQSGGAELSDVAWDGRTLRGVLNRPAGQQGFIVLAGAGRPPESVQVAGEPTVVRAGASGSFVVPVATRADATPWEARFA